MPLKKFPLPNNPANTFAGKLKEASSDPLNTALMEAFESAQDRHNARILSPTQAFHSCINPSRLQSMHARMQ